MKLAKGEIDAASYVQRIVQKNIEYITSKDEVSMHLDRG
jgi:hypothetical protein